MYVIAESYIHDHCDNNKSHPHYIVESLAEIMSIYIMNESGLTSYSSWKTHAKNIYDIKDCLYIYIIYYIFYNIYYIFYIIYTYTICHI